MTGSGTLVRTRRPSIAVVKAAHSVIFFAIASAIGYVVWSGATGTSDRRALAAGAIVVGEAVVFTANGLRCPLTDVAERLGAESGSVSDIYLPRWAADHIPHVTVPAFALGIALHVRNMTHRVRTGASAGASRSTRSPGPCRARRVLRAASSGLWLREPDRPPPADSLAEEHVR